MSGMDTSRPIDQALAALVQADHAFKVEEARLEAELAEARRVRDRAIARASRDGVRQNRIIDVTGYSRETIRQIVRDNPVDGDDQEAEPAEEAA
jgi:hypothetical protein